MFPWLNVSQLLNLSLYQEPQGPQGPLPMGPLPDFELEFPGIGADLGIQRAAPFPYEPNAAVVGASAGLSPTELATPVAPSSSISAVGIAQLFGGGLAMIGTFFGIKGQQEQLKTQSLSMEHEASMSAVTARQAEKEALSIEEAGAFEKGAYGMQARSDESTRTANMAGRGIQLGVGSAAEVQASGKFIEAVDKMSIDLNTANAAAAARTAGVNARNRGLLAGVSARNLRRSAGNDLLGLTAAATTMLGTTSRYRESRRRRE